MEKFSKRYIIYNILNKSKVIKDVRQWITNAFVTKFTSNKIACLSGFAAIVTFLLQKFNILLRLSVIPLAKPKGIKQISKIGCLEFSYGGSAPISAKRHIGFLIKNFLLLEKFLRQISKIGSIKFS